MSKHFEDERAVAQDEAFDKKKEFAARLESEKPQGAVIGVVVQSEGRNLRSGRERLDEAMNLTLALDIAVRHSESVTLRDINPATLLGGGKVQELFSVVKEKGLEVVVIDAQLSPRQQRQLEQALNAKVLDRTGLILEIFSARARTAAGRLQVELAQASYQQSRLVRLWSHLERQRGGGGKTAGPGERQLELDKRMLRDRMGQLKRELREVEQTRGLQRMARTKAQLPTVALVGYTNAGKSTLFNALVDAGTLQADALFATLDPLMRRLELPGGLEVVLVDTVGFIADLPHELVEAFKATLEEVVMADVLLHVQDASSPERAAQAADVQLVLSEIGAAEKTQVVVLNKADRLAEVPPVAADEVAVSARTGFGTADLLAKVEGILKSDWQTLTVTVSASDGKRLAWLHAHGEVILRTLVEEEWRLQVKLRASHAAQWARMQ